MSKQWPDAFTISESVRRRRKALGLSAKAVARAAGVSPSYLSQLEHGVKEAPSLPVLRRLAEALSMDLHDLVGPSVAVAFPLSMPAALAAVGADYAVSEETLLALAQLRCEGRQPPTYDDWLFVLMALRRGCHLPALPGPSAQRRTAGQNWTSRGEDRT